MGRRRRLPSEWAPRGQRGARLNRRCALYRPEQGNCTRILASHPASLYNSRSPNHDSRTGPEPQSALFCSRFFVERRRDFGAPIGSQSEISVTQAAILVLEDGTVFEGESVGAPGLSVGEVVFNTALTG